MSFKNFTLRYELVVNIEKKLIVVNNLELYNMPLTTLFQIEKTRVDWSLPLKQVYTDKQGESLNSARWCETHRFLLH